MPGRAPVSLRRNNGHPAQVIERGRQHANAVSVYAIVVCNKYVWHMYVHVQLKVAGSQLLRWSSVRWLPHIDLHFIAFGLISGTVVGAYLDEMTFQIEAAARENRSESVLKFKNTARANIFII